MAVYLRILLILTGLTGIDSLTTVSKVSVKAGGSVSIPCLYDSQYRNHVKYLCEGYYRTSCSYAVKTNQQRSGRFSISDDKNQRIFTVTINNLKVKDTDYWCVVEINNGADDGVYFQLSVTRGTPSLYVENQEIRGFKGESIKISCHYSSSGETKWCRLGSSCVTTSSGSIDGTRVTIDETVSRVFTVTMSELRMESSGWYWCVKGDLQMPVHVTVTERPTTTAPPTTIRSTTLSPTRQSVNITSVSADKVSTTVHSQQQSLPFNIKSLIIPLSLLVFVVIVTLFVWFMLRRCNRTKEASPATTAPDVEVLYSAVKPKTKRKTSAQSSRGHKDADVVYSDVVTVRPQEQFQSNGEDVTYSTLAHTTSRP